MTNTQIPRFLEECVTIDDAANDGLDITALYGRYVGWCLTRLTEPIPNADFVTALRHLGIRHDDDQGPIRFYPGLRIVDPLTSRDLAEDVAASDRPAGWRSANPDTVTA
ncbi:hypothetical protein [Paenarthrobacter sp. NPDC058040]|uniref:hypothetical protein n=1 Tax=unclassified Paenarthrobacter TaxID=2634190 RepID=UPI0036DF117B